MGGGANDTREREQVETVAPSALIQHVRFVWDAENELLRVTGTDPRSNLFVGYSCFNLDGAPFRIAFGEGPVV